MTRTVLVAAALCLTVVGCASTPASSGASSPEPAASSSSAVPQPSPPSPTPTPTPTTFPQAYSAMSSGVIRLDETTCDGDAGSGSGFLVAPDLVATAAHVVDGAHSLSARAGKSVTHATVVDMDTDKDVALVRLGSASTGRVLEWGAVPPVGGDVAVVGYPLGEPLSMTLGHVNAVGARIEIGDTTLTNLVKYDAATNPGNSGGPLITVDGRVAGLVEVDTSGAKGESYAIPVSVAQPLVNLWQTSTDTVPLAACADPWRFLITVKSTHADAPTLALMLWDYFGAINGGDFEAAFGTLTATARTKYSDPDGLAAALAGASYDRVVLQKAKLTSNTTDTVTLSYKGHSGAGDCQAWQSRLVVRNDAGFWQIESETQLPGSPRRC